MSNNPDEIRADIERTRQELGRDVDALAEKVNPTKAAHRQGDRVREGVRNLKESVMGTPDPYAHQAPTLGAKAENAAYDVRHAAEGAEHVKGEGQQKAGELKDDSTRAAQHVKGAAQDGK